MKVGAILLAAGSATRFGSNKLLHALPHDVPIAVQSARHLKAVFGEEVIAVVRSGAEPLGEALAREGCRVVPCPRAEHGMGESLACGVRAATGWGGYIVALADMPFIRASTIEAVREALKGGAPMAAPYFRARRGHPVGIAGRFREELEALRGDEGAKKLVAAHAAALIKIPVGDPGVLRDIDKPSDLSPPLVV